jgi:hypothetical protein
VPAAKTKVCKRILISAAQHDIVDKHANLTLDSLELQLLLLFEERFHQRFVPLPKHETRIELCVHQRAHFRGASASSHEANDEIKFP